MMGQEAFSPASNSDFGDSVITINGFSKKYSMTGWRIGYAVANEEITKQMTLINMYNCRLRELIRSDCVNRSVETLSSILFAHLEKIQDKEKSSLRRS